MPLVEARLQTFQPQNARGDLGVGKFRLRCIADDLARLKRRACRFASPIFSAIQRAQRRAVRAFDLPDAEEAREVE